MTTWLHRITHLGEFSFPLLKNHNLLSIGFSDFIPDFLVEKDKIPNNEDFIERVQQGGVNYLDDIFLHSWGNKDRARFHLFNFIRMNKGDWVVVPEPGKFSVYEILDHKACPITSIEKERITGRQGQEVEVGSGKLKLKKDGSDLDLGFVREVKPIQIEIPRDKYGKAELSRSLKYRRTNKDITKAEDEVKEAVNRFAENKPINIYQDLVKGMKNQILDNINTKLNHEKFEILIEWYFTQCGATETVRPSKNSPDKDGDADVIATFEPLKTIYYIQAKFHDGKTPVEAADQIVDYVNNQGTTDDDFHRISWVISTAESFTQETQDKANNNHIQLINGDELAEMILEIGIHDLDRWV